MLACRSCLSSSGSIERWNDGVDRPPNCFCPVSTFLRAAVARRTGRDDCWTRSRTRCSRCRRRRRVLGRPLGKVCSNCRSIGGNLGVEEGSRTGCRRRSRREGLLHDRTSHDSPPSLDGVRCHRCSTYLPIDFFFFLVSLRYLLILILVEFLLIFAIFIDQVNFSTLNGLFKAIIVAIFLFSSRMLRGWN